MPSLITLTTDFGPGSAYVAAMKGVILSINPAATIIDLTHSIGPQDVREGAIFLASATHWFPPDTIHVAVIDPGVGTKRPIIYARIDDQHYLAPDNGLLSRLVERRQPFRIIRLENSEHWLPEISATFHGRDIIAPVAAQISLGLNPSQLGPRQNELVRLDWPQPRLESGQLAGAVMSIDSFGNLITNIGADLLGQAGSVAAARISCGGDNMDGLVRTYGDRPDQTLIALIGSSGFVEISVVRGNAAQRLAAKVGDPVTVSW